MVRIHAAPLFPSIDPRELLTMKVSIAHVDTCLSDYWAGNSRPHLQIPAYRQSFKSVRDALRNEVRMGAVAGNDDDARLLSADCVRPEEEKRADMLTRKLYAAINRDVRPAKKGDHLAFRDIKPDEDADVYAFFVVVIED